MLVQRSTVLRLSTHQRGVHFTENSILALPDLLLLLLLISNEAVVGTAVSALLLRNGSGL